MSAASAALPCPVCESVSLIAQRDPKTRLEIDVCPRCHGLWFDARELPRFLQSEVLRGRFLQRPTAGASQSTRDSVRAGARPCPRCQITMKVREYAMVALDVCEQCHGSWFDDGEVQMVVARFKKGARGGDTELLEEVRRGLGAEGVELFRKVRDHLADA